MLRQFSRPGKKWLRLPHFLCIIKYVSLISLLHIPPNFQGGMRQGVNITLPVCWNGRRGGLKILWWRHRVGSSPTTGTIKRDTPLGVSRFYCGGTRKGGPAKGWAKIERERAIFSPWESPYKKDGIPQGCWLSYIPNAQKRKKRPKA